MEVYSQNKNEDDFLENLGLLTQVIKDQDNQDAEEEGQMSFSENEQDFNDHQDGVENPPEEETIQNDSFTLKIEEATNQGMLDMNCANWCIEAKKNENRRVLMTYNAFKRNNDLQDFAHSLLRLHKNATK